MKTPPPKPLFTLRVEAQDSSAVWPMVLRRDDPAMHDRIQEGFYADEDFATVGFDIADMDDLLRLLKFYEGRAVQMSLGVTITTPEMEATASLSSNFRGGPRQSVRALETEALSPATAASKLQAIAHSLTKWKGEKP
jgi:hypothetical protein